MCNLNKRNILCEQQTCIDVNIAETSYVGLHLFCKISKQIPPSAYTFGWNIFETNRTVGGLFGYSSVNSIVNLKVPSSNGVSWGLRNKEKTDLYFLKKHMNNYIMNSVILKYFSGFYDSLIIFEKVSQSQ